MTERCSDQATRPRHASTISAHSARAAPTAMKTVPSGKLYGFMNGAFFAEGGVTIGVEYGGPPETGASGDEGAAVSVGAAFLELLERPGRLAFWDVVVPTVAVAGAPVANVRTGAAMASEGASVSCARTLAVRASREKRRSLGARIARV